MNRSNFETTTLAAGLVMLASGLIHLWVWMGVGGSWEGAISWRKPVLFGISTGLTSLSVSWIVPKLKPWFLDHWIIPLMAGALTVEVGLITLQQWRGVGSHFNRSTVANAAIETTMTWLVGFAAAIIFVLGVRSVGKLRTRPDMRLAIRAGMLFLIVSMGVGFLIHAIGTQNHMAGRAPEIYGEHGVLKFPHGIAIHAIQLLPLVAWALRRLRYPRPARIRVIALVSWSIVAQLGFALYQTFAGRARLDVNVLGGFLLGGAVLPWVLAGVVLLCSKTGKLQRRGTIG